jgi:uncharacterized Zn-binding protein involved in type VI secretion
MSRPYIVIGDKTSHGGTVISADFTSTVNGKAMARTGDQVVCPRCKGVFPITEGDPSFTDEAGKHYARQGDKTACGASLIPSQGQTYYKGHGGAGGSAASLQAQEATTALTPQIAVQAPTICLECLIAAAAKGGSVVRT